MNSAVFGRGEYAEPVAGAERRLRLSPAQAAGKSGVQPPRSVAGTDAALHAGADHASRADRRLQSAPYDRPAALPLASAFHGSPVTQPLDHDTGIHRPHAGCAPRRRYPGSIETAAAGCDFIFARINKST